MEDIVIETSGLTKWYGSVHAVDGLSLQVRRGQVFGLLGPNGSGKTTTMGMLLGLVRPTAGSVRLFGLDAKASRREVLGRVGAIVEEPTFYPHLSGRANLQYFRGISQAGSPEDVARLLEMVGLSGDADRKLSTYSLGMRQRLGLAYALLGEPELLLLDEPTNGMDPAGMAEVRGLIRQLGTDGYTVLLSSHMLHEVEKVCDYVGILSRGRLIAQGRVEDLLRQRAGVRLKTTDDLRAAEVMSSISWVSDVATEDGYLMVSAPPERSWEMTEALSERNVYVSEMSPIQVSLERYFLEVTTDDASAGPEGV